MIKLQIQKHIEAFADANKSGSGISADIFHTVMSKSNELTAHIHHLYEIAIMVMFQKDMSLIPNAGFFVYEKYTDLNDRLSQTVVHIVVKLFRSIISEKAFGLVLALLPRFLAMSAESIGDLNRGNILWWYDRIVTETSKCEDSDETLRMTDIVNWITHKVAWENRHVQSLALNELFENCVGIGKCNLCKRQIRL